MILVVLKRKAAPEEQAPPSFSKPQIQRLFMFFLTIIRATMVASLSNPPKGSEDAVFMQDLYGLKTYFAQ